MRDGGVLRPVEHLQLEEAPDDGEAGEQREERHPLVAPAELTDVGASDEEIAHDVVPPVGSARDEPAVAAWSAWQTRNTSGATAAVAMACGRASG